MDLVHSMTEDFPNCSMETVGLVMCRWNISPIYWSICLIDWSQISYAVMCGSLLEVVTTVKSPPLLLIEDYIGYKWIEMELQVSYWLQELLSNAVIELICVLMLIVESKWDLSVSYYMNRKWNCTVRDVLFTGSKVDLDRPRTHSFTACGELQPK